eukprot:NODE_719_length_727_cov_139.955752_g653_i0.p1 GENE.NODE_719_length_727_cov_139.955752_g653_i0~~NODE_719_length_727_cov_139.955752_g653_i0.p1  ORF type:complete len:206 (-),score=79.40 NODE_719_length_727_cov_139.955752_g653_i0:108-701(-)
MGGVAFAGLMHRFLPPTDPALKVECDPHEAASLAGAAFSNGSLGVCHSIAHKMGAQYHVPHGPANALYLPSVIEYNARMKTGKGGLMPRVPVHRASDEYAELLRYAYGTHPMDEAVTHTEDTTEGQVAELAACVRTARENAGLPDKLSGFKGVPPPEEREDGWQKRVAHEAFDDQCTGANPIYPTMADLEAIIRDNE